MGAVCHAKVSDDTTHVISTAQDTDKMHWAKRHSRHMVSPNWLYVSGSSVFTAVHGIGAEMDKASSRLQSLLLCAKIRIMLTCAAPDVMVPCYPFVVYCVASDNGVLHCCTAACSQHFLSPSGECICLHALRLQASSGKKLRKMSFRSVRKSQMCISSILLLILQPP